MLTDIHVFVLTTVHAFCAIYTRNPSGFIDSHQWLVILNMFLTSYQTLPLFLQGTLLFPSPLPLIANSSVQRKQYIEI